MEVVDSDKLTFLPGKSIIYRHKKFYCAAPSVLSKRLRVFQQGTITEGEGSVQLTSLFYFLLCKEVFTAFWLDKPIVTNTQHLIVKNIYLLMMVVTIIPGKKSKLKL